MKGSRFKSAARRAIFLSIPMDRWIRPREINLRSTTLARWVEYGWIATRPAAPERGRGRPGPEYRRLVDLEPEELRVPLPARSNLFVSSGAVVEQMQQIRVTVREYPPELADAWRTIERQWPMAVSCRPNLTEELCG